MSEPNYTPKIGDKREEIPPLVEYSGEEINAVLADYMCIPFDGGLYKNSYEVMATFPPLDYSRTMNQMEFPHNLEWLQKVIEKLAWEGIIKEVKTSYNNETIGTAIFIRLNGASIDMARNVSKSEYSFRMAVLLTHIIKFYKC